MPVLFFQKFLWNFIRMAYNPQNSADLKGIIFLAGGHKRVPKSGTPPPSGL